MIGFGLNSAPVASEYRIDSRRRQERSIHEGTGTLIGWPDPNDGPECDCYTRYKR